MSVHPLSTPDRGRRPSRAGRSTVLLATLLVTAVLQAAAPSVAAQSPRTQQRLLLVNQTVTEPAAGVRSTVTARVGVLAFTPSGLATDRVFEPIDHPTAIAQVASPDFGTSLTQGQLLAQAASHFASQAAGVADALRRAMQARGLGQASFVYDQRVIVAGAARPRQLVWTLSVDSAGRYSHASPQLFDQQPEILHAQYVPLRVAEGLPPGWAYPDGGRLRWQRLDLQLQPTGPVHEIDTGGAFDPPEPSASGAIDPEAGLRCLIDLRSRPDCPPGPIDLVTLIDHTATGSALLDYGLRLSPVYDAQVDGSGQTTQVARVAMQVDLREVSYGGCTADMPYRNRGSYGFSLRARSDRYAVARDGRHARLNSTESVVLSPTEAYDWTRPLRPVAVSALAPLILDPQDPARPLLAAADIGNLLHLAPITTRGEAQQTVASFTSPAADITRLQLEIRCSVEGTWTTRSIIAPWAQCRSGSCNSDYYPYEASFTRGQPAIGPYRWTAVTYRGLPWEPQQVEYDGADTITFWHVPESGCSPMVGARFSLAGAFLGVANHVPCPPAAPEVE